MTFNKRNIVLALLSIVSFLLFGYILIREYNPFAQAAPTSTQLINQQHVYVDIPVNSEVTSVKLKLDQEVQKVIDAGHLAPYRTLYGETTVHYSWAERYASIYALSLAYRHVDPSLQPDLKAYLDSELAAYPVWQGSLLPNTTGTQRSPQLIDTADSTVFSGYDANNANRNKLFALYALWSYVDATGDWTLVNNSSNWSSIVSFYNSNAGEVNNSYMGMSGAIGYARLAYGKGSQDLTAYNDAVSDLSTGLTNGLNVVTIGAEAWDNYYWDGASASNPSAYNWTKESTYFGFHLLYLTPEMGRYITDPSNTALFNDLMYGSGATSAECPYNPNLLTDNRNLYSVCRGEFQAPLWYMSRSSFFSRYYGESTYVPVEYKGMLFPVARYLHEESASALYKKIDVPDAGIGDYYYMQGLVYTIEANGTECMEDLTTVGIECDTTPQESRIANIVENLDTVEKYSKFEITFDITDTSATNLYLPYFTTAPAGLPTGTGITVDVEFSQNNFSSYLTQPAFIYQEYDHSVETLLGARRDITTPTGQPKWSARFAPKQTGNWQYRIRVTDALGTDISSSGLFTVSQGTGKGFLKVSDTDRRYFEFEDGTPFIGIGHGDGFGYADPISDASDKFTLYDTNGVNFIRVWMSGDIMGSAWGDWRSTYLGNIGYLPNPSIDFSDPYLDHDVSYKLDIDNRCIVQGWESDIDVKPSTTYQYSVIVKRTNDVSGGANNLALKVKDWYNYPDCEASADPGATYISNDLGTPGSGYEIVTGEFTTTGGTYLINKLYLAFEGDVTAGDIALIDEISIREKLGPGSFGGNIIANSNANSHYYYNDQKAWEWDKILEQAEASDVYLKLVISEKNDELLNNIGADGEYDPIGGNDNFYTTAANQKVRKLHEFYWRYLTARYGYSTAVHSWELVNEGDPYNGYHFGLTNALGAYMDESNPSMQMASTSAWADIPLTNWNSSLYSSIDYTDFHAYIDTGILAEPYEWEVNNLDSVSPAYSGSNSLLLTTSSSLNNFYTRFVHGQGDWTIRYKIRTASAVSTVGFSDCYVGFQLYLDQVATLTVPNTKDSDPHRCSDEIDGVNQTPTTTGGWFDDVNAVYEKTFTLNDTQTHRIELGLVNNLSSGSVWIDNFEVVSPDGVIVDKYDSGTFESNPEMQHDSANYTESYSRLYGFKSPSGSTKPIVRGEAGITELDQEQIELSELTLDLEGVWLKHYLWAQMNPGGLYEMYWFTDNIQNVDMDPTNYPNMGLYPRFAAYSNFMAGIQVNNGAYDQLEETLAGGVDVEVFGQKDITNKNAHLWVKNSGYTWWDWNSLPSGTSGTISIPMPAGEYQIDQYDTELVTPTPVTTFQTLGADESIVITISGLTTDVAYKIINTEGASNQAPAVNVGTDQEVNIADGAILDATVTDDGEPNPPATVTTTWTKQSGPGTVTFGNASLVDTTADFSVTGLYVLRLTADDSELSNFDQIEINVTDTPAPENVVPSVDAGTGDTIYLSETATLNGTVSDDGLPNPPATVTTTWSKTSGPGTANFLSASSVDTSVTFTLVGTYVLRLTANDSALSAFDEVTVIVEADPVEEINEAPVVNAGVDQNVLLSAGSTLDATVTDDGLPNPPATFTVTWSETSGPGTVTFGSASNVDTTASYSEIGTYILRITVDDSELTSYDEIQVIVEADPVVVNEAPSVATGVDQSVSIANGVTLDATVTDDGLPNPPAAFTVSWSKVSGPGDVTFAAASSVDTTATFSVIGTYVLRLTADDSELTTTDDIQVVVVAAGGGDTGGSTTTGGTTTGTTSGGTTGTTTGGTSGSGTTTGTDGGTGGDDSSGGGDEEIPAEEEPTDTGNDDDEVTEDGATLTATAGEEDGDAYLDIFINNSSGTEYVSIQFTDITGALASLSFEAGEDWKVVSQKRSGDLHTFVLEIKDQAVSGKSKLLTIKPMFNEDSEEDLEYSISGEIRSVIDGETTLLDLNGTTGTVARPPEDRNTLLTSILIGLGAVSLLALLGGGGYWLVKVRRSNLT